MLIRHSGRFPEEGKFESTVSYFYAKVSHLQELKQKKMRKYCLVKG